MKVAQLRYVLITPARNEEAYIELTIKSVVNQTWRPVKWIIVSDGSTDGTDEIVMQYLQNHSWIELVQMPARSHRDFGGKVACFNAGWERAKEIDYNLIGNLDADMSFESDLFAFLTSKFSENPQLGVAGAPFTEGAGTYDFRFSSVEHVSGACQLFRRECFEAIGGYIPIEGGGIDVAAVLNARVKGWQTKTFPERSLLHHRPMGTASHGRLKAWYRLGQKDYILGRHILWQTFRSIYQMRQKPVFLGGSALLAGYLTSCIRRLERPVSREVIELQRREQMLRLRRVLLAPFRKFAVISPFTRKSPAKT
jgi:glycosyltransferase involved in cell wall biosynthesis